MADTTDNGLQHQRRVSLTQGATTTRTQLAQDKDEAASLKTTL
jgi:hypothetical protein